MSWARFDDKLIDDPDVDEFNIGAAGIGLFCLIVITGQKRQNPRVPMATIRRLPGGNRRNLAKLTAAGWLIEIEKGNAFYIRSLDKYSSQKDGAAPKKSKFGPVPEPDPAPPVSPRVSAVRAVAGSKGGHATAAKRRRPEHVANTDVFATDLAKHVAKTPINEGDFASKNGALSGKNGHENGAILPATHAGASNPVSRIPEERKESNTVDVSLSRISYTPAAREGDGETSTDEDFEQSSGLKQETPFDGASYWSPEQLTAIVAECPQVAYWSHQKRAAVSEIEHVTGDTHSRADWGLLFDAAFNGDRLDVLHAAITTVKGAKRRGSPPANMGAYANTTITNFLGRVQIFVPSAAERAELPPDIRSELRSQFSDDAISPPADARDGPGAR